VETASLLDAVSQRVNALLAEHTALRAQLGAAQVRVRELEDQLADQTDRLHDFQTQENITRIAGSIAADSSAATELKLRINDYLREIDRCIAYLKD
jgi:predicted  nucleic acid-binding Zn-ribbon protein